MANPHASHPTLDTCPSLRYRPAELDPILLLLHYASVQSRYAGELALPDLSARAALSMLRFAGTLLPADRAFFEAGVACRDAGAKAAAFMLLNRYVDCCDAMDDAGGDLSGLDNSEFVGTGIPAPVDMMPLRGHYVDDDGLREDIRNWILASSIDKRLERALPTRPCPSCSAPLFEAALGCSSCHSSFPACIATGYPAPASQATTCGACGSKALKTAWNAVVAKTKACPWCAAAATPSL